MLKLLLFGPLREEESHVIKINEKSHFHLSANSNKIFKIIMIKKLTLILALSFLLSAQACSVVAAANGSKEPNLSIVKPGEAKYIVEAELGAPTKTKPLELGSSSLYTYKLGDEPAPGRALLYLLGDIVTLCLAEYIFFPVEISNSGNAHHLIVDYNTSDMVVKVRKPQEAMTVDNF